MKLVWLRRDLRTRDNRAIAVAQLAGEPVVAVYAATPEQWDVHNLSSIQRDLIYRRLAALNNELGIKNIPLGFIEAENYETAVLEVIAIAQSIGADEIIAQCEYEVNETRRDALLTKKAAAAGIKVSLIHDRCVLPPGSVLSAKSDVYKVFTPFKRAWLKALANVNWYPVKAVSNDNLPTVGHSAFSQTAEKLEAHISMESAGWYVDEMSILRSLREFTSGQAARYDADRDFPSKDGTSVLSPYLAIGALSPRQCLARVLEDYPELSLDGNGGPAVWISEIIWREFYQHLSAAFPKISRGEAFIDWADNVKWDNNKDLFEAWKSGKTGFPIVDAAMRQLADTGWMHNRLRMIVASFLTKDLLIDWRWGEAWFSQKLVDLDYASNNGGWQWSASTGTDAQPYFRIFNPTSQGQRFDPKGDFVREWMPELREIEGGKVHEPHKWAHKKGINLDYPLPIVDHSERRKEAISRFEQAKGKQSLAREA
ncbi:deoxyribodipyrimidine photo-lyase [Parasalinivibrio latis]|uniref:deoxyribodipyrimidine photo-lyase n=1 Tax=Parasalinivibrio latis TaxID=2952610 RepID=UPI0030E0A481